MIKNFQLIARILPGSCVENQKILVRRKVPREKWEEISKSMLGKPGIELWDVIRVVTAPPELGALDAQTFQ